MPEQQSLAEQLKSKLKKEEGAVALDIRSLFHMDYKEGPIQRQVIFPAKDKQDAYELGSKYVKHLAKIENRKVVMIGIPKLFAMDIEAKITADEAKRNAELASLQPKSNAGTDSVVAG